MLEWLKEVISKYVSQYLEEHPRSVLLGILVLIAAFCGGTVLFGYGPINAIERLFFPARFVTTATGSAADWYQVYTFNPPQDYDPDNMTGEVPEALIALINEAQDSIHVAGFEFNLTPVADALIDAHYRGVDVKWYTDDEHGLDGDDDEDGGQFAMMIDAGIKVRDDDRQGLMHNKFIVFDEEKVWTGSTNLTRNGMFRNDNNVIIIESPSAAARYEKQFKELWQGKYSSERRSPVRRQTMMIEDTAVMILFAPEDDAMDYVLPLVKRAKDSVHFMTFAFTHDDMGKELVRQARRGVDVQGVFEARNASSEHSEIHRLYCNGIDVREDGNSATMHHKAFVIDGKFVITGSYNFSNNSENTNDENLIFLSNWDIAEEYEKEFQRVWAESTLPYEGDIICP